MIGIPRRWLLDGDAREEVDRAVAEYMLREHGGSEHGEPTVLRHTILLGDGSRVEGTAVFVNDEDGWWSDYARLHEWPDYGSACERRLKGQRGNSRRRDLM
jgi:hypothetical protein